MRMIAVLIVCLGFIDNATSATISGKVTCKGVRDNRDSVVYIDRIPGKSFPPPKDPVVMDQLNLTFIPHVLPVLVGTTVSFPNSDEVRHNVFSPSPAKRFNLGTYPKGTAKHVTFDKPGEVVLLCNVHAEMSAYIVTVETPYVAVSSKEGDYRIQGLPPGKYIVRTWHEALKPQMKEVEIKTNDETVRLDFEMKK